MALEEEEKIKMKTALVHSSQIYVTIFLMAQAATAAIAVSTNGSLCRRVGR